MFIFLSNNYASGIYLKVTLIKSMMLFIHKNVHCNTLFNGKKRGTIQKCVYNMEYNAFF